MEGIIPQVAAPAPATRQLPTLMPDARRPMPDVHRLYSNIVLAGGYLGLGRARVGAQAGKRFNV